MNSTSMYRTTRYIKQCPKVRGSVTNQIGRESHYHNAQTPWICMVHERLRNLTANRKQKRVTSNSTKFDGASERVLVKRELRIYPWIFVSIVAEPRLSNKLLFGVHHPGELRIIGFSLERVASVTRKSVVGFSRGNDARRNHHRRLSMGDES